jgi:hypothetical protein
MIRETLRKTAKGWRPQGSSLSYCPRFAVRQDGREDRSMNRQAAEAGVGRGGER